MGSGFSRRVSVRQGKGCYGEHGREYEGGCDLGMEMRMEQLWVKGAAEEEISCKDERMSRH